MTCEILDEGGLTFIVCSRGRRRPRCSTPGCGGYSVAQCDFPLKGKAVGKTCSKHLCPRCKRTQGKTSDGKDTVDYCNAHHEIAQREGDQKGLF